MAKYHLTEDGPKKCTAQPGNCPKVQEDGRPAEHFYNMEDAQRGYEAQLEREHSTFETISANSEVQETSENSKNLSEENFQSLVSEMRDIEDEEFPNHAQVGDEYVTLRDCADPNVAENNCWAASAMAAEQFPEFKESTLTFDNGDVHVALVHDETDNVVDYTMRQFDHESDFPYVGTYQDWKKKVTTYMSENRSASLKN